MALACNTAWSTNTIASTQRVAQCVKNTDRLAQSESIDGDFERLVMDALERLRIKGTFTIPALSTIVACDLETAAYQANCAVQELAMPDQNLPPDKIKAIILWQLTQALCS